MYYPDDVLNFGKNQGVSLKEVYKYQPSYIEWAIINISDFKIHIESFENLPNPTPVEYKPENFDIIQKNNSSKIMSSDQLSETLNNADFLNPYKEIKVKTIKEMIVNGDFIAKEINYTFPKSVIEINNNK